MIHFTARLQIEKILEELDLKDKSDVYYDALSVGQKQRLVVALSLLGNPKIFFFDELSTGLDPQSRRNVWDIVKRIRNRGKTIVLVTHFMDEAEILCDRVAVIDRGKILDLDSPHNLVKNVFKSTLKLSFTTEKEFDLAKIKRRNQLFVEREGNTITVYCSQHSHTVDIINFLISSGINFSRISVDKLSLEDVFLNLTGRNVRD